MAFPDDYRRVQFAGGIAADVNVHVGLPAQVIVDKTNWNIRLLDGNTEGGFPVQMVKDLAANLQAVGPEGEALYIAKGTAVTGQPDSISRIWKASKLKAYFDKFSTVTVNEEGTDFTVALNDSSLRSSIRSSAALIADLNAATASGWYRFAPSGTANMPADMSTSGSNQAMMLVLTQAVNTLTQMILARDGSAKIWLRNRLDGDWAPWALATGVTGADLALRVSKAGDAMTGKLTLAPSSIGRASANLASGIVPDAPNQVDGDIWRDATGFIREFIGGVVRKILTTADIATAADRNAGTAGKVIDAATLAGSRFISTPIPLTLGTTGLIAHGLGARPKKVEGYMLIVNPLADSVPGDVIPVYSFDHAGGTSGYGTQVMLPNGNDTQVRYRVGNAGITLLPTNAGLLSGSVPNASIGQLIIVAEL